MINGIDHVKGPNLNADEPKSKSLALSIGSISYGLGFQDDTGIGSRFHFNIVGSKPRAKVSKFY